MIVNTNQDRIPLTKEGLENLKKEYQQLVEIRRPQAVVRMASSRKVGDLTEESEYTQAKQELDFIDGRISELDDVINKAIIIDENHGNCPEVKLGCRVTVQAGKDEYIFHLVGEWEADPAEAKISHQSPLGQSLLGKKIGNKVEVKAPAGKIVYTIIKID
jgi:transcription elongation factor GreA